MVLSFLPFSAPSGTAALAQGKTAHHDSHYNPVDKGFVERFLKASDYIPVDEIKPGMEGYGLTVFQGTKVERFQVKVIGVIKQALSGRDAILIRLSGPHMGKNNVIRGMSGSPIYIGNRLAGALSYGFDFSKESIVGVTPVVDMLDALSFDTATGAPRHLGNKPDRGFVVPGELLPPPSLSRLKQDLLKTKSETDTAGKPVDAAGAPRMVPLLAPVSLSGYSSRAQQYLAAQFRDVGLNVTSGASGGLNPRLLAQKGDGDFDKDRKVVPGGAVAVMLSTGDFAGAATGTATCTFRDKFIAFGHAFIEAGGVSFPLASAYIHEILPSLSVSFKLSSPLEVIGTIFADRPWSVGGEVGRVSELIPLNLSVTDEVRQVRKTYKCKLVEHPDLTSTLTTAAVMSALDATYQSQSPYVVKVKTNVEMSGQGKIERVDRFPVNFPAHPSTDLLAKLKILREPVSGYVGGLVDRIIDNDFERTRVKNINVDITIEDGRKVSRLERLYLDKAVAAPGDTVTAYCVLKPYDGPAVTEKVLFTLPRDLPDGDLAIGVCGGDELEAMRKRMGVADPSPENFKQVLARLRRKERSDRLCGLLALPRQSLILHGDVLRNPPAQWLKPFFSERATRPPALVRGEERVTRLMENIVDGSHIVAVTVKRPDKIYAKGLPFSFTAPGSTASDGIYITEQAKKALDVRGKSETPAANAASGGSAAGNAPAATGGSTSAPAVESKGANIWSSAQSFPHLRAVSSWRQEQESEFRNGTGSGVMVDSLGRLTPGFQERDRAVIEEALEGRIFACQAYRGNLYFLAGKGLYVYRPQDKSVGRIASVPGIFGSSLVIDESGTAIVGSAGSGEIQSFKLTDGKVSGEPFSKVDEEIVTALALDGSGNLYIGTAGTGKLYRARRGQARAEMVLDCGQAHITALNFCPYDQRLYIGTAERGLVLSLSASGESRAEFESGEHIVTGVAKDKAGNLFVTTAGQGKLLRVAKSGQIDTVALSDAFYTLYHDSKEDRVYSGDAEGDITRVEIDPVSKQAYFLPVCHTEQEAVLALAGEGGQLYACTSNIAQVRSFDIEEGGSPTYASSVFDAGKVSHWSRFRLVNGDGLADGDLARGIKVETRGGLTAQPDSYWSAWTEAELESSGDAAAPTYLIKSGNSRYLQYRLSWKPGKDKEKRRTVGACELTYQPGNTAPTLSSVSLSSGEAVSGTVSVSLTGADVDSDNLLVAVEISSDGGKTFSLLNGDLRSRQSIAKEKAKRKAAQKKEAKSKASAEESKGEAEKAKAPPKDSKEPKEFKDPKDSKESAPGDKDKSVKPETRSRSLTEDSAENATKPSEGESESKEKGEENKAEKVEDKGEKVKEKEREKEKPREKEKEKDKDKDAEAEEEAKTGESYSTSEKFLYKFDSRKHKDGRYLLRLTLSDRPSNARGSETAVALRDIIIDNSPPTLSDIKAERTEANRITLSIKASDKVSEIADAIYRIEGFEPFSLAPKAGTLADGHTLEMSAANIYAPKSAHKVTIEVFDRAGNTTKQNVSLP